jgi:hypothetical protein
MYKHLKQLTETNPCKHTNVGGHIVCDAILASCHATEYMCAGHMAELLWPGGDPGVPGHGTSPPPTDCAAMCTRSRDNQDVDFKVASLLARSVHTLDHEHGTIRRKRRAFTQETHCWRIATSVYTTAAEQRNQVYSVTCPAWLGYAR